MQKVIQFKTKGMQRDLSSSAFNSEYAYENKNVRVMPTDESTLLSLINEKGNKKSSIDGVGDYVKGIPIGQSLINDELILFTCGDKNDIELNIEAKEEIINDITFEDASADIDIDTVFEDRIYKLWFNNEQLAGQRLFRGDLGLNYKSPIETLSYYENSNIKKVYWTDGLNQLRVINIASSKDVINKWNSNSFDFVSKLKLDEQVTIAKRYSLDGNFPSGVIQYIFTYYNKYSKESNIFYVSPLYYMNSLDKAGSPEDRSFCTFDITISNLDSNFEYVRIYSIHRTSIDATPSEYLVSEMPIVNSTISYTDNGINLESLSGSELLFKNRDALVVKTINQKDNVLFAGNIKFSTELLTDLEKQILRRAVIITEDYKKIDYIKPESYYPYSNNLGYNSRDIKGFKGGDWYRIAIQFQNEYGVYSEPIYIKDIQIKKYPNIDTSKYTISLPSIIFNFNNSKQIASILGKYRYKSVRILRALSTEKSIISQGVLCPTLYNLSDRVNNSPFSISSWFMRPISNNLEGLENRHNYPLPDNSRKNGEIQIVEKSGLPFIDNITSTSKTIKLYYWFVQIQNTLVTHFYAKLVEDDKVLFTVDRPYYSSAVNDLKKKGIKNEDIPTEDAWRKHSSTEFDILANYTNTDSQINEFIRSNSSNYYVDQNILTFHAPNIESIESIANVPDYKLRIIGVVPITSVLTDYMIQSSSALFNTECRGEIRKEFSKENLSTNALGLINAPLWNDSSVKDTDKIYSSLFVVYPWHREGSLNDDTSVKADPDKTRTSLLSKKIISNLRYSYYTKYFNTDKFLNYNSISSIKVFNSNEISNIIIDSDIIEASKPNYYGNVDKVLTYYNPSSDGYPIQYIQYGDYNSTYQQSGTLGVDPVNIRYKSTPHIVLSLGSTETSINILPSINIGNSLYNDIVGTGKVPWNSPFNNYSVQTLNYWVNSVRDLPKTAKVGEIAFITDYAFQRCEANKTGSDASWSSIAPKLGSIWKYNNRYYVVEIKNEFGVQLVKTSVKGNYNQSVIDLSSESLLNNSGFLYLAEIYREVTVNSSGAAVNIYGDNTTEGLLKNQWIPISNSKLLSIGKNVIGPEEVNGDTYFMRWDCLKTYPYSDEDKNQIVDITSFMVESEINLDGRHDSNRGNLNNLYVNPTNFNLFNSVYNQDDNYFNYRITTDESSVTSFPNSVIWSLAKTSGDIIDNWTSITTGSSIDLDGDKGEVNSINRFNNNLVVFQDTGISAVLYNESMQLSTTEGVPIEIANSGRVTGKRYISTNIGCQNKWSICETSNGIYFIDDITKGIFLFNGQPNNISDKYGFHSWINRASKGVSIWNPIDFNSFVTYYDKVNGDVFFISKDECLAFSEPLGQFTSFYSYEKMPYFSNLEDRGISFNVEGTGTLYRPWLHNEGDYNMYFGVYQPFYTTVIANPDMSKDKIFNNLEFRSDTWDKEGSLLNTTFDTLTTWNEYQEGTSKLTNILGKPSDLKKKFRIWRANIPRSKANGRDRMRNPWLYIKLSMEKENTNKTILHDVIVHYFE